MTLRNQGLVFVLLLAFAPACEEEAPPGSPPEITAKPADDASVGRRGKKHDAAPGDQLPKSNSRVGELRGSWQGKANTKDFGLVSARLTVDEQGLVQSTVTGPSLSRTDTFKLMHWDGKTLRVVVADSPLSVPARLKTANELTLTLPQVGAVSLTRQGNVPLPKP